MKKFDFIIEDYKNNKLFSYEEKNIFLLKKIIDKEYQVQKEYKNDKRTYVAKILIDGKLYILKQPYNNKFLKKIIAVLKKCESLTVLKNVNKLRNKNIKELVNILGAGIEKNIVIKNEFYVMEYSAGETLLDEISLKKILETAKKLHSLGCYHGDCNPYNFLFDENGIHIIDTKLKKMFFGNYRAHYDILTLMKYFKNKIKYPYKKNIFYYLAYIVKKMRSLG